MATDHSWIGTVLRDLIILLLLFHLACAVFDSFFFHLQHNSNLKIRRTDGTENACKMRSFGTARDFHLINSFGIWKCRMSNDLFKMLKHQSQFIHMVFSHHKNRSNKTTLDNIEATMRHQFLKMNLICFSMCNFKCG